MSCHRFRCEAEYSEGSWVFHNRSSEAGATTVALSRIDTHILGVLASSWLAATVGATKRLFVDRHLVLRAIGPNDSTHGLPGRCPPQPPRSPHPTQQGASGIDPRTDAPRCDTRLATIAVADDPIGEVSGGSSPRACVSHKVLRFWQAGHCYPPRLARTNRELLWESPATNRQPLRLLASRRTPLDSLVRAT